MKVFSIFLNFFLSLYVYAQDFNFVAVGDTGKGNEAQYAVAKAMEDTCNTIKCNFGILLGDNFYQVGVTSLQDPQFQTKFEKPYATIPFPFYVALGNHDYGKYANDWKRGDVQVEYSKVNPNWILPSYYYSYEHNDVLFLVLDTSRLFHDKDTKKQKEFFKQILKENKKKWVVAVGHHPYISNGEHGNAGQYDGVLISPYSGSVIKKFIENDLCKHVDVYLSGHDHSLQTLQGQGKCANTVFVVSGAGAAVDELEGTNPVLFQKSVLGFTLLKVKSNSIDIQQVNAEGEVEHSILLLKP